MRNIVFATIIISFIVPAFVVGSPVYADHSPEYVGALPEPAKTIPPVAINPLECQQNREPRNQTSSDPRTREAVNSTVRNLLLNAFTYNSLRQRLRCDPLIVGKVGPDGTKQTTGVYKTAVNVVNLLVLIALVVIGFANILRIKMDTYAVKKSVPLLVFGVVLANLGLPIIRTIVDFAGVLTATFITAVSQEGTKSAFVEELIKSIYHGGVSTLAGALTALDQGTGGWTSVLTVIGLSTFAITAFTPFLIAVLLLALFLIFFPALLLLFLGLLFVARIYVIVILAAVSPAAFVSIGIEPLRGRVWSWWWSQFLKWTFMAPASFFLLWLGIRFFQAVDGQPDIGTYIVSLSLILLASQIPLKMGGTIMTAWNERFVKPLRTLALKPLTAGGQYLQKAAPRDVSRFLSNRQIGVGRFKIPLNLAKAMREYGTVREAYNTQQEQRSRSARLGQFYGQLANSVRLRPTNPGQALAELRGGFANRYDSVDARQRIAELSKDLAKQLNVTPGQDFYGEFSNARKARYNELMAEILRSRDPDRSAAAALLNAQMGRSREQIQEEIKTRQEKGERNVSDRIDPFAQLRNLGIDPQPINNMFDQLFTVKGTPVPHVSDPAVIGRAEREGNTSPDRMNQLKFEEYLRRVDRIMADANKNDQEKRGLLTGINLKLQHANVNLANLQELERNPNYKGMVAAFLKYGKSYGFGGQVTQQVTADDGSTRSQSVNLEQFRPALNLARIREDVFNHPAGRKLLTTLKSKPELDFTDEDLRPIIDASPSLMLTSKQMEIYRDHQQELKESLVEFVRQTLEKSRVTGADVNQMITDLKAGEGLHEISPEQIVNLTALQGKPGLADNVYRQLRPYHEARTRFEELESEKARTMGEAAKAEASA